MPITFNKKICLLGDGGVGKTSLVRRFVDNIFDDAYVSTMGAKTSAKDIHLHDFRVKLVIWDLLGQKTPKSLLSTYMRGAEGAIFVCDLGRPETVSALEAKIAELFAVEVVPFVVLGNKYDLPAAARNYQSCWPMLWQIAEQANALYVRHLEQQAPSQITRARIAAATGYGGAVLPTSAKDGLGVEDAFLYLTNCMLAGAET